MRRISKHALLVAVCTIGVWVAFPPAREWQPVRALQEQVFRFTGPQSAMPALKHAEDLVVARTGDGKAAEKKSGARSAPPAPVTAATAVEADMPIILSAPGIVEPLASVAVKPRVDGQIVEVAFKEGDLVREGQILFKLDDRLVNAQIKQAEAVIAQNRANLMDAESILARREALVAKKIVSEAATETQRMSVEAIKAAIVAGQALLDMQKTQLDYLIIKAPITGRTGSLTAKLGAAIRAADPMALVTINQIQPVAVSFALPQAELPALKRSLASGASAEVVIPGEKPIAARGRLWFVDNQVDKQTGTITAKVMSENADEMLWPGQAVEVALTAEVRRNVVAVPAAAVVPSQLGMVAWVIGADGKVAPREVALDRMVGQTAFLTGGLKSGERVVTDGQLRLAPGMAVTVRESGPPPAATAAPPKRDQDSKEHKPTAPPTAGSPANGTASGRS